MNFENWKHDLQKRVAEYLKGVPKRPAAHEKCANFHRAPQEKAWMKAQPPTLDDVKTIPPTGFPEAHLPCINDARCCGSDHGIEVYRDGDICLFDDHDSNAGTAVFTGYCSLSCLLLDIWHVFGNDGRNVGDQIRDLKKQAPASIDAGKF